jgi:LysR family transcriptional regulator, transcription activator of glutamate synthase operon
MESHVLRWLVAVADGNTVAEVAARHHTTQPAVSRGLQRLSGEVGATLTERVGRRLALTFAGEIVADAGRRILTELDAALRAVAEADDPETGLVRLGFLSPLGTWLVPRLLVAFRDLHPAARVQLRHDGADRILSALLRGELDLLIAEAPPVASELAFSPLFDDELVLAVSDHHQLAGRRSVHVAELAGEQWVVQPEGYGSRRLVRQICVEAGIEPDFAFEDHDLATLRALIGSGSGIGLFADRPAPPPGVTYIPLRPKLGRTVGLVTRPGHTIPRAAAAFAALVVERAPAAAARSS